jgi:hypothetical protein
MSSSYALANVYTNEGIQAFGRALRFAIRDEKSPDFASLVELEYVETKEDFADVIKKFLRRYETQARQREQRNQATFRPNQTHLEMLMTAVDNYNVRPVRAALIAHALVRSPKKENDQSDLITSQGETDNE